MRILTRRQFIQASAVSGAVLGAGAAARAADGGAGFQAATAAATPDASATERHGPGIQSVIALCEVTGGGEKVYGIAIRYDTVIVPASLGLDTYATAVLGTGGAATPQVRPAAAVYTHTEPGLRSRRDSLSGVYVIVEFAHDPDLSLPSADSDRITLRQVRDVRTATGATYASSALIWENTGRHGANVAIRGVDDWEQNHWWRDDARSAWLEYSIYLPKSFLKPGGEAKAYPLVIAITHSGTSPEGTCAATLTEQCIASIWGMPEQQALHECVVVTPRYERTTLNDYWEHTPDVENTYRLVTSLLENRWNFGNPNLEDRRDKVLKIDPQRVYCTGWSMGAMTSLWMMAAHPETFAAGLIIAGQQRPADLLPLATQKVLIITGANDTKATPWNERCVPLWERAGAKVTRPAERLDPTLIFPVEDQRELTRQIEGYLAEGGNITFLTFADVDHMGSARKFFHIRAARDWLLRQVRT